MNIHTDKIVLRGRYRLDQQIGEGGMGEVWLAYDLHLCRQCVVKRIKEEIVAGQILIKRFLKEAKAMARVDHPNIVAIYDVLTDGERPALVMQLVKGVSVDKLTELPPREALRIACDALRGIAAAHEAGIVHRDVKPANIMIDRSHNVRVTDFGVAQLPEPHDRFTRARVEMGSKGYMAPEQRHDAASADHRADIYATGTTLYRLITGEEPHTDFFMVVTQAETLKDVPPAIAEIIKHAVEYEPSRRYQTADEMREAIEAIMETFPRASELPFPEISWLKDDGVGSAVASDPPQEVRSARSPDSTGALPDPRLTSIPDEPASRRPLVAVGGAALLALLVGGVWMLLPPSEAVDNNPNPIEDVIAASAPSVNVAPSDVSSPNKSADVTRPEAAKAAEGPKVDNIERKETATPKVAKASTPKRPKEKQEATTVDEGPIDPKVECAGTIDGGTLTVVATVVGMTDPAVKIRYRPADGSTWKDKSMSPSGNGFRTQIALSGDLTNGVAYYVEASAEGLTKRKGNAALPIVIRP